VSLKKVVECLKRNKRFLVTTHINLEGDALGSELAFVRLLRALGKQATLVNESSVPCGYDFLPGIDKIKKFRPNLKLKKFDCLAALDCSDLGRAGEVGKIDTHSSIILNIDHHISNSYFGTVNWVEPGYSSCCQMVYDLYKKFRVPLDKDSATLLYVGMLTDTGSFRYPNTTSITHKIVSELLRHDLNVPQIHKDIYGNIPFEDMKLLSCILSAMKREATGRIVWFQIAHSLFEGRNIPFDLTENILNFARAIKGVEVAVIFREGTKARHEIKVNLRSQGKADVNKIAACFDGGGHKTASGCTIPGTLSSVRRKVLRKIKESLE